MDTVKNQGKKQDDGVKKSRSAGAGRTRAYAFLVYPDSAPEGWIDKLRDEHVQVLISPLHDMDENPDGSKKKPHYHVLVLYDGVKTIEQATELRDSVGGVGWENVASVRGYARYLCHLDDPSKAQYAQDDVIQLGGADYSTIIARAADAIKALAEMMDYISDNNVIFYADFVDYCRKERLDWFEVVATRYTYTLYTYIKARGTKSIMLDRDMMNAGAWPRPDLGVYESVNQETGEIEE